VGCRSSPASSAVASYSPPPKDATSRPKRSAVRAPGIARLCLCLFSPPPHTRGCPILRASWRRVGCRSPQPALPCLLFSPHPKRCDISTEAKRSGEPPRIAPLLCLFSQPHPNRAGAHSSQRWRRVDVDLPQPALPCLYSHPTQKMRHLDRAKRVESPPHCAFASVVLPTRTKPLGAHPSRRCEGGM